MIEMNQVFHVRYDDSKNWVMIGANGRVYARSPFKDTVVDLARQIARNRAPSVVHLHSSDGKPAKNWSYSKNTNDKKMQMQEL